MQRCSARNDGGNIGVELKVSACPIGGHISFFKPLLTNRYTSSTHKFKNCQPFSTKPKIPSRSVGIPQLRTKSAQKSALFRNFLHFLTLFDTFSHTISTLFFFYSPRYDSRDTRYELSIKCASTSKQKSIFSISLTLYSVIFSINLRRCFLYPIFTLQAGLSPNLCAVCLFDRRFFQRPFRPYRFGYCH